MLLFHWSCRLVGPKETGYIKKEKHTVTGKQNLCVCVCVRERERERERDREREMSFHLEALDVVATGSPNTF